MKKFPRRKAMGELGTAFVANVVFEAGSIFRRVPEETDLGIDGYIEFVEDEIATGLLLGIQIKAGSSYLVQRRDAKYFEVEVSRKDLNYWSVQPIPTALIVYDPETNLSGWLDVTGYIRRNPEALQQDRTVLTVHSTARPFNTRTVQGELKATCQNYRHEADLFGFANLMISPVLEEKFRGYFGLLSHPTSRFSRLTCYLLLQHLFHHNGGLRAVVSDALSRYLPHPEVGFVPPPDIRNYVESALKEFGRREVSQLLETAWLDDENLMQRGSLGQSVGVIISYIPGYEEHLCGIAVDSSQIYEARWGAIALAAEFGLDDVIECVAANFDRVEWGDVREAAQWAVEESLRIEAAETDLSGIVEYEGSDTDHLADVLREASLCLLVENETIIAQVFAKTANPLVRFEAGRAIDRIMKWRYPAELYMEKLV